jgi:hypothetical protein
MMLGIIVLGGVLYQFYTAMNEAAYWDLRIASMDRRIQRKTAPQVSSVHERPEMKREVRKANAVMNELDLPWGALFDSLEYAASHDVALLSIQPDASSRKMRIGGEAKNIPAMLDFVGALEREPALKDAHLLKYEIKREDPHRPVTFFVSASWA